MSRFPVCPWCEGSCRWGVLYAHRRLLHLPQELHKREYVETNDQSGGGELSNLSFSVGGGLPRSILQRLFTKHTMWKVEMRSDQQNSEVQQLRVFICKKISLKALSEEIRPLGSDLRYNRKLKTCLVETDKVLPICLHLI